MIDYKNIKAPKHHNCRVCLDIIAACLLFTGFVSLTWLVMAAF